MSAAALESLPEIGTSIRSLIAQNIALLEQGLRVIDPLSDRAYESIGAHVRHSLDIYSGILRGVRTGLVDHASRARDPHVERSRARALVVIRETIARLRFISADAEDPLLVRLDHDPSIAVTSTVGRELESAASHTIHHYAVIALVLRHQGIETAPDFGVAPSTLRYRQQA